jgi:hypothetical protein
VQESIMWLLESEDGAVLDALAEVTVVPLRYLTRRLLFYLG